MILLSHILIALTSIGYTTYVFFAPSQNKLRISYALVALTIGSGTLLTISSHARILDACVSGLTYTGIVSVGILLAQRKLATAQTRTHNK
jgi:hypothetical protein